MSGLDNGTREALASMLHKDANQHFWLPAVLSVCSIGSAIALIRFGIVHGKDLPMVAMGAYCGFSMASLYEWREYFRKRRVARRVEDGTLFAAQPDGGTHGA